MAAITTLDTFGGASNPLGAGDGWTAATSTWLETGGIARPTTYATDAAMSWSTAFTEVVGGVSTDTKGVIIKTTLGAMTAGSEMRVYWRATNAADVTSDRYYIKIKKASLELFPDVKNDEIELWKIVSTVHTQIGTGTTLKHRQNSVGDLRNYVLNAGDSVTVASVGDIHIIKISATDRDGIKNAVDVPMMVFQDSSISAGAKYVGLWSIGGSHTNSIQQIQAALVTARWCDPAGSDSNQGSQSFPYATPEKLAQSVLVNEIGILGVGSYGGNKLWQNYSTKPANGTSYEDAPTYVADPSGTVQFINSEWQIKDTSTKHFEYLVFYGITLNGGTVADAGLRIWSQEIDTIPDHIQLNNMTIFNFQGSGCFNAIEPTWTVAAAHESYLEIRDITTYNNGITNFNHGLYIQTSQGLCEYVVAYHNAGDGVKWSWSGNGQTCDDSVIRYNLSHSNGRFDASGVSNIDGNNDPITVNGGIGTGLNIGTGDGLYVYGNQTYDNDSGIFLFDKLTNSFIFNNWCSWNWANGINLRANQVTPSSTGHVLYNNTCAYNGVGFSGHTGNGIFLQGLSDSITLKNNICYGNSDNAYLTSDEGEGFPTNITLDYNLEAADTGFKGTNGVVGDPLFVDTTESMTDLRLMSGGAAEDTGVDLSATIPAVDFDWKPRPQNAGWDIGALEFPEPPDNSPTWTVPATVASTVNVSWPITQVSVADADGDITLVYISTDKTTTLTASGSATVEVSN